MTHQFPSRRSLGRMTVGREVGCPVTLFAGNATTPLDARHLVYLSRTGPVSASLTVVIQNDKSGRRESFIFNPNTELFGSHDVLKLSTSQRSLCHYVSTSNTRETSALSTCSPDSVTGLIHTGNFHYSLSFDGKHFFLNPTDGGDCGFFGSRSKREINGKGSSPYYYKEYSDGRLRYVELVYVADNSVYLKYDKDEAKVKDRMHTIANLVNALYVPLNVRVVLVSTEVWASSNKIEVVTNSDTTLRNFLDYRKEIYKRVRHDNAQLITDLVFDSTVIGKAYKGTMCAYDYSGGVIMDHAANSASVAATSAHEMGHSFGMGHDNKDCECPASSCIMAESNNGYSSLSFWSRCSLENLQSSFLRKMDFCLHNAPKLVDVEAKCGNGIVENGEECDCGNVAVCPNKCCIAKTCKLAPEAVCAGGECCDTNTCMPKARTTTCRDPLNDCDLPEFCDGETGECPPDFTVANGEKCPGDPNGYCFDGQCGSRVEQCRGIWGPTGYVAPLACYERNRHGNHYGNCKHFVENETFTPCAEKDIQCGLLHCLSNNEIPVFGDTSTVRRLQYNVFDPASNSEVSCRSISTTYVDGVRHRDPGLVRNGASCGKDRLCLNSECMNISNATMPDPKCEPPDCAGHGICNNVGNCHCDKNYGGVDCTIPGYGGSINSNPAYSEASPVPLFVGLLFFALIALFIGATWYFWRKKQIFLPQEIWRTTKNVFNIQAMLVPTRPAPPRPGDRHYRSGNVDDLNAVWGDNGVTLHVAPKPVVPPTVFNKPILTYNGYNAVSAVSPTNGFEPKAYNVSGGSTTSPTIPESVKEAPPPPVPPHKSQHNAMVAKKPTTLAPDPPPKKKKPDAPQLPKKPLVAKSPVDGPINVKNLAARFDQQGSS